MAELIAAQILDRFDAVALEHIGILKQGYARQGRDPSPEQAIELVEKCGSLGVGCYGRRWRADAHDTWRRRVRGERLQRVQEIADVLLEDLEQPGVWAGIFLRPIFESQQNDVGAFVIGREQARRVE